MKTIIEIREDSLNIVRGKVVKGILHIRDAVSIQVAQPLYDDHQLVFDTGTIQTIKKALKENNLHIKKARFIVNNKIILMRDLTIPKVTKKQKRLVITHEFASLFNLNEGSIIDYRDLEPHNPDRIIASSVPIAFVKSIEDFAKKLKIKIVSLEGSSSSMIRLIQDKALVAPIDASLVIDIASTYIRSYLFINGDFILFRTFFIQKDATIEAVTMRLNQVISVMQEHPGNVKKKLDEIVLLGHESHFSIVSILGFESIRVHPAKFDVCVRSSGSMLNYGNALGGLL